MNCPRLKQRIRIKRPTRGYEGGKTYVVVRIDTNDNTLMATDSEGREGPWIQWRNCEPCLDDINWSWLKNHLPSEALELLSAFEGLDGLRLSDTIRDRILMQLPNLKDRILTSQVQLEEEVSSAKNTAAIPGEDEDEGSGPPF